MQNVSAELALALTAPERVIGTRLTIDWDNDGYNGDGTIDDLSSVINNVNVTQALTTNVPSTAQPVVGAAVAQLHADLGSGHFFGNAALPVVRSITTSTAATGTGTISIARPAGAQAGDLILLWIAHPGQQWHYRANGANATWLLLSERGDFSYTFSQIITNHLLIRRIGNTAADLAAEPTTYTFRIPATNQAHTVACICVDGGTTTGIHAYSMKGADVVLPDNTFTQLDATPITTTLDGCTILGFFAAYAGPGGGVTWTTTDTELVDVCSTSGVQNSTITVTQSTNVSAGTGYVKSATISTPTVAGVVTVVALGPRLAGDDTQNAAWTYSELNTSAMYAGKQRSGRNVTCDLVTATSTGLQSVRIFTGRSLTVDVSSRQRKARLTAQDNRELFRAAAISGAIPDTFLAESPFLVASETLPSYPGLEVTWLVSYLVTYSQQFFSSVNLNEGPRSGDGFFASPTIRQGTILHVPCHGSLLPFEGTMAYGYMQNFAGTQSRCTFALGPWVAGTSPAPLGGKLDAKWYAGSDTLLWGASGGSAGRIEYYVRQSVANTGTVRFGAADDTVPAQQYAYLDVAATGALTLNLAIAGGITRSVAGPTVPQDTLWHAVGVHWDASTGVATFKIDSTVTTAAFATFVGTGTGPNANTDGYLIVTDNAQVAELQVCGGVIVQPFGASIVLATDPFVWDNFSPTAFIDRSENILDAIVPISGSMDIWQLLTSMADAEFAALYCDALGRPHYRTRYSDLTTTGQTVQRTLTTLNALQDLDYTSGATQIANQIKVSFTPASIVLNADLWRLSSVVRVPASGSVTFNITLSGNVINGAPTTLLLGNGNTAADGTGTVIGSGLGMSAIFQGSAGTVIVTNSNTFDVWLVDNTGNPTMKISGSYVTSGQTAYTDVFEDTESMRRNGTQPLLNGVSDSVWRQKQTSAEIIAQLLLADLAFPRPVLTNVKIAGDPRLELGDLVQIVDRDGLGVSGNYRIVEISPAYSPGEGFTQIISARFAGCGVGTWDVTYWDDCSVWGA